MTAPDAARRDDPFRWLLDVGRAMVASASDLDALQDMAAAIARAMNVTSVDIQSYDAGRHCLIQEASWTSAGLTDRDLEFIGAQITLDDSPTFRRLLAQRRIEESHIDDPGLSDAERAAFEEWGYRSTLDAPLIVGGEVVGVLGVTESRHRRRFMATERERLEQLACLTAAAIRNVALVRHERRQSERLAALLRITSALAGASPQRAAELAVHDCLELFGVSRITMYRCEAAAVATVAEAGDGVAAPIPSPVVLEAIDEQRVALAVELAADDPLRAAMNDRGESQWLIVPIAYLGRRLGWLLLAWREAVGPPEDDLMHFAATVAEQLAIGFENEPLPVRGGAANIPGEPPTLGPEPTLG